MSRLKPGRLAVESLEDRAVPAAYTLDPAFNAAQVGNAQGAPILEPSTDIVQQVVPLADGGTLVATLPRAMIFVVPPTLTRLDAAGQIVRSFGTDGRAVVPISTLFSSDGVSVTVQADGQILVGATAFGGPSDHRRMMAVARLTADGRPDLSFGPNGVRTPTAGYLSRVVVQPDGKILLGGTFYPDTLPDGSPISYIPSDADFVIARLTADGELDPTFGAGGQGVVTLAPGIDKVDVLRDMALTPDGRIVVTGGSSLRTDTLPNPASLSVARLTADGRPDGTFGTGGIVPLDFGMRIGYLAGLAVRPDGRIVVGATTSQDAYRDHTLNADTPPRFEVVQLTATGTPDAAFGGGDGRFVSESLAVIGGGAGVGFALDAAGRAVLLTGDNTDPNAPAPAVVGRLAADGSGLDSPFAALPLPAGAVVQEPEVSLDAAGRLTLGIVGPADPAPPLDPNTPLPSGSTSPVRVARFVPPADEPTVPKEPRVPVSDQVVPGGTFIDFAANLPGRFATDVPAAVRFAVLAGSMPQSTATGSEPGRPAVVTLTQIIRPFPDRGTGTFAPFEAAFTGGVFVDAADFNQDGVADLVVTAGDGGGAVVAIYDGARLAAGRTGEDALLVRFLGIPDAAFRGGTRPAVGDVTGDGIPDLVIAAGAGGGPRVTVWDGASLAAGAPRTVADFFAFEDTVRTGATVAVGDSDGDGVSDLLFGAGPGGGPRVREFSGAALFAGGTRFGTLDAAPAGAQRRNEFVGDPAGRSGVPVRFVPTAAPSRVNPLAIDAVV